MELLSTKLPRGRMNLQLPMCPRKPPDLLDIPTPTTIIGPAPPDSPIVGTTSCQPLCQRSVVQEVLSTNNGASLSANAGRLVRFYGRTMSQKIQVVPYTSTWQKDFDDLVVFLRQHPVLAAAPIEHVGSTSVEGLAAKPIIDLDMIADNAKQTAAYIATLEELGYRHRGDLGITGREAFFTPQNIDLPVHNLYVCIKGSLALQNHLRLRYFLRKNVKARTRYSQLKYALAEKYLADIDRYCEAKSDFIVEILRQCRTRYVNLACNHPTSHFHKPPAPRLCHDYDCKCQPFILNVHPQTTLDALGLPVLGQGWCAGL